MSPEKIIHCSRSGIPLVRVQALCTQGWPMLSSMHSALLHPIYAADLNSLLAKLSRQLADAENADFKPHESLRTDIALSMSAIMWTLESIQQDSNNPAPSLPSWPVCIASASRLLQIATWWHFASSKRLALPTYHTSAKNNNLEWQNFSAFLDAAFSVKEEWETGRKKYATQEEIKRSQEAIKQLRNENIYKRIDFNKVWNWIDAQLAQYGNHYPQGRRDTLKSLFMSGDLEPENWITDDIDDLCEAVFECCDQGNEITHFIRTRLNHIREVINEFYGSFTIVSQGSKSATLADTQTEQEQEFFAEFDRKIESLDALPPPPKREHFASLGLFLRANAQHNILARRFAARKV